MRCVTFGVEGLRALGLFSPILLEPCLPAATLKLVKMFGCENNCLSPKTWHRPF